ncbi:hypothetical protein ACFY78_11355 [Streptomyces olindensis]|uniref:hypothetical protein n=1 Tax=Streptomyces olindensis TaxID=358823 RepID=UPI0036B60303
MIDVLKKAATLPLRMVGRSYPSLVEDAEHFVYRRPVGFMGVISLGPPATVTPL